MNPAFQPARDRAPEPRPDPDREPEVVAGQTSASNPTSTSIATSISTSDPPEEPAADPVLPRPRVPRWLRPGLRLALALLVSAGAHLLLFSLFVLQPPAPRGAAAGTRAAVVRLPTPGNAPVSSTHPVRSGPTQAESAWEDSAIAAGAPRRVPLQPIPAAPGGPPQQTLAAGGFRYPSLIAASAADLPDLDALPPPQPVSPGGVVPVRHRAGLEFVWRGEAGTVIFRADEALQAAFRPLLQGTDWGPLRLPAALDERGEVLMVLVPASVPGPNRHHFAELCRHLEVSEASAAALPGRTTAAPAAAGDANPTPSGVSDEGPLVPPAGNSAPAALRWGVLTVHQ